MFSPLPAPPFARFEFGRPRTGPLGVSHGPRRPRPTAACLRYFHTPAPTAQRLPVLRVKVTASRRPARTNRPRSPRTRTTPVTGRRLAATSPISPPPGPQIKVWYGLIFADQNIGNPPSRPIGAALVAQVDLPCKLCFHQFLPSPPGKRSMKQPGFVADGTAARTATAVGSTCR